MQKGPPEELDPYYHHRTSPTEAEEAEDEAFQSLERQAREALELVAAEAVGPEAVEPYYQVLTEYRDACEGRCLYREAQLVQAVVQSLRLEQESHTLHQMTEAQMEDRRRMEAQHREMFRQFHLEWNERISQFEEHQLDQEVALLERQNEELFVFYEQMKDYVPSNIPRISKRLVEGRTRQAQLAEQKEYAAAHAQMLKADEIEMEDLKRLEVEKAVQFRRKEELLKQKHEQEQRALALRVESRRLQLERVRKQELDKLLQTYVNYRRTMENQQNIVRGRTGQMMYNHAKNTKTDKSATVTMTESAKSGTYGPLVAKRYNNNNNNNNKSHSSATPSPPPPALDSRPM